MFIHLRNSASCCVKLARSWRPMPSRSADDRLEVSRRPKSWFCSYGPPRLLTIFQVFGANVMKSNGSDATDDKNVGTNPLALLECIEEPLEENALESEEEDDDDKDENDDDIKESKHKDTTNVRQSNYKGTGKDAGNDEDDTEESDDDDDDDDDSSVVPPRIRGRR
jgi:hypothetical protein